MQENRKIVEKHVIQKSQTNCTFTLKKYIVNTLVISFMTFDPLFVVKLAI